MRLTTYSDYAMRILIYLATHQEKQHLVTIKEISSSFATSHHHISKIVFDLGKLNLVATTQGRGGGIRLTKRPNEINLGYVIRLTEESFNIVECFDEQTNSCILSPICRLKHILREALEAYLLVLDKYTLEDATVNSSALRKLLQPDSSL